MCIHTYIYICMNYSLQSLKGVISKFLQGSIIGLIKGLITGDTRSVDYS